VTENRPFTVFEVRQCSYREQYQRVQINFDALNLINVIGQGAFGKVFLSNINSNYFAVKMLQKQKIAE